MIYLRHARIHDDAELPAYVVKLALPFPMTFTTPITILTGENGKGKSTVLEALASAMGVDTDGGSRYKTQERTSPVPLVLTRRNPPDTFFFRGDAHLNLARYYESLGDPSLSDLTQMSHGQSIMALAERRFGAESLIFLDEPEAGLSVLRQLELLGRLGALAEAGAQIIMATHSPILLAAPEATIISLDDADTTHFEDTLAVRATRDFLADPVGIADYMVERFTSDS
ncbi:AAA family ATPase [uncultured Corynebacterium sp.]|uniref:AAA family ATPase n=1 Tax=uncultured Corynebacterium sp. TaxID=159447 RepID=UPI00262DAD4B|nr:AAA family ATPase [uncultured Corynebacterium sp.]